MKIIGQGAQYKVIDFFDGRVVKIPLTRQQSRAIVAGWYRPHRAPLKELRVDYQQLARLSCNGLQGLVAQNPRILPHLANPSFTKSAQYTQDKVTVLGDILKQASSHRARILTECYAEQIVMHWQYGFSEIVWNPLTNNGIDAKGNIVLLDLGEITFDKTVVDKQITAKSWLKTWAYTKGLPDGLKAHYRTVMENTLTFSNLKKWSELTEK